MSNPVDQQQPEQWYDCDACDGSGVEVYRVTIYEAGCGFPHDDSAEKPCEACGGVGGWIEDVVGVTAR